MSIYRTPDSVISNPATFVSTDNSSTTSLDNGEDFTGTWEDVGGHESVVVSVSTDQDGMYQVQFSPDGVNQDSTLTRYYRTNQINVPHRFTITRQYCRIKFTNNSGSNQTYFRLQTLYGDHTELNAPVDSTAAQDFDAIVTRPTDFTTEVALGRRQGFTTWNKFGYNEDIDTSIDEVIAEFGGAFNQRLSSAETLSIVSSSASDINTSGTGLWNALVYGVDGNWNSVIEVVPMNGTSAVTTSNSYLGVNRLTIFNSGSADSNVGLITATASSSGNVMATMPTGQGTTQQLIFYVPQNHQFLISSLYLSAIKSSGGGSPEVTYKGFVYSDVVSAMFEVYRDSIDTGLNEHIHLPFSEPLIVGEKSIVWFEAGTSSNNTSVRGRFSGKLVRDVDA